MKPLLERLKNYKYNDEIYCTYCDYFHITPRFHITRAIKSKPLFDSIDKLFVCPNCKSLMLNKEDLELHSKYHNRTW